MTDTPDEDQSGFVAEEPDQDLAPDHLLGPSQSC